MKAEEEKKVKAVAMLSGGLDSSLAVKIIADMGIEVSGVNYNTGFCLTDHHRRMTNPGARTTARQVRNEALQTGARWRIPVKIVDISKEYMQILTHPKHGYGSAVNPCIDCRIFMLQKTREYMEQIGAGFIITGEVIGQRPMTQMRDTLRLIERQSGCEGLILRPLSAKRLPLSVAELNGWVEREKLYGFNGRSRKPQIALAEKLGLSDYPQPAGGCCFLTDKNYARRLQDLFRHCPDRSITPAQVLLLKVGRHFRLNELVKAIVGRNEADNLFLEQNCAGLTVLSCPDDNIPGPTTLVEGSPGDEDLLLAARLTARYSDGKNLEQVHIAISGPGGDQARQISVAPLESGLCDRMRI
ncbi:MAG: hypothetical protein U9P14_02565 [Gemmatimonadota bacterium]|nr:hypothetical protein [Gemmatimonadota bacterium]